MGKLTGGWQDAKQYLLGRGELYFSSEAAGSTYDYQQGAGTVTGPSTDWRFLGNTSAFSIANSSDKFEHVQSISGLSTTDFTAITKRTIGPASATLEYFDPENTALIFSADVTAVTNDLQVMAAFEIVGRWLGGGFGREYQLVNASGGRVMDLQTVSTSNVSVRVGGLNATSILTDKSKMAGSWNFSSSDSVCAQEVVIDTKLGTVYVPGHFGTAAGAQPAPYSPVEWQITNASVGNGAVTSFAQMTAFTKSVTGQLLFKSVNARSNATKEIYFPDVEIVSNDIPLITADDVAKFEMEITINSDTNGVPFYVKFPFSAQNS